MRESWEALGVVETEWHRRLKSPFTTVVVRNNKSGRMNEKKSLAKKLSSFFLSSLSESLEGLFRGKCRKVGAEVVMELEEGN